MSITSSTPPPPGKFTYKCHNALSEEVEHKEVEDNGAESKVRKGSEHK